MLLDYLRLFRLPNVFTALADILMGYLFVQHALTPIAPLAWLLVSSSLLYTAGMVLNDVYDIEVDRQERPFRPLPAGKIGLGHARRLGYGMLLAGVAAGWAAGFSDSQIVHPLRTGAVATALAACVVLYDAWAKKTPAGPVFMGACRFFNVLLGMSIGAPLPADDPWLGYSSAQVLAAGGIGLYIIGVTWFARTEARDSSRLHLALATVVMLAGFGLLALMHRALSNILAELPAWADHAWGWYVLLAAIAFPIVRRCLQAVVRPEPALVQRAVKTAIFSLIMIDGAVSLHVAPALYAVVVVSLLAPMVLLGKWVYST